MSDKYDVLVRGGLVVTAQGIANVNVGIRGEKIVEISPTISPQRATKIIDANAKLILPGAIDVHVHPIYADDLGGVSIAAAFGGVTTMIHFAYVKPGQKVIPTLKSFREEALAKSVLDFAMHAGLFDVERQLEEVPNAFGLGVTSFKVFMAYAKMKWMTSDYWLSALMDVVANERGLTMVHAENGLVTDYLEDKYLREERSPVEMFTKMRPALLEAEAINRAISIAQVMGCPLYVPHVSAAACLEPLRQARKMGWKVYGETCPQYLTLTSETTSRMGAQAKIGPPLRTSHDNESLWQGLADGTLVTIGSDHAPKKKARDDDFFEAPFGTPQIETMTRIVYHAGINDGKISLPRLVQLMSETPAKIFGLFPKKGTLQIGSDADLVIFDPTKTHTLSAKDLHSGAGYTPYEGHEVTGAPILTMQRGKVIFEEGRLLAEPGRAQFLATDTSHLYD